MKKNKQSSIFLEDSIFSEKVEELSNRNKNSLINNYVVLININLNILEKLVEKERYKSVIIYQFGTVIEIFFKFVLLDSSSLELEKISNLKHNIPEILNSIKDNCIDYNLINTCDYINDLSKRIKKDDNKDINYIEYPNFRYNHNKDSFDLLFTKEITSKEINYIEEVIKCIKSVMKI